MVAVVFGEIGDCASPQPTIPVSVSTRIDSGFVMMGVDGGECRSVDIVVAEFDRRRPRSPLRLLIPPITNPQWKSPHINDLHGFTPILEPQTSLHGSRYLFDSRSEGDGDRRANMPAPTRCFVRGCCRAFPGDGPAARVFGPVETGPRPERPPRPGLRLLPSPSPQHFQPRATPERGQMLRRACRKPLASVFQHGSRRQTAGMEVGSTAGAAVRIAPPSLDQLFPGFTRAVASLLRRTGEGVCRLHAGLPALGNASVERMRAGSLCDAGLMRRAPGTFPPTLRHGPPDLAPDFRSDEGRRRSN